MHAKKYLTFVKSLILDKLTMMWSQENKIFNNKLLYKDLKQELPEDHVFHGLQPNLNRNCQLVYVKSKVKYFCLWTTRTTTTTTSRV